MEKLSEGLRVLRLDVEHAGFTHLFASIEGLRDREVGEDVILAAVKGGYKAAVDEEAERRRNLVATPGAGQAMEYQETEAQAREALVAASSGTLDPAAYPMLAATVGLDIDPSTGAPAVDVLGVARSVMTARNAWVVFGSALKAARLKGKAAIDAASGLAAAEAAYNAITWPAT